MAISSAQLSGSPGNYGDPLWRMVVPAPLPPSPEYNWARRPEVRRAQVVLHFARARGAHVPRGHHEPLIV